MNNPIIEPTEELALRIDDSNLNPHLWNNNETRWIHYTIYPTPVTAERIRQSLKTRILSEARKRRDDVFRKLLNATSKLAA